MVITSLSVLVVLACAGRGSASFQIIRDSNRTTIDYEPSDAWKSSLAGCHDCPVPPSNVLLNGNSTWTNGTNAPTKQDEDDVASPGGTNDQRLDLQSDDDQKDDDDNKGKGKEERGDDDNPDSDDPNFVPVKVTFRFTASSFALHALVPTSILPLNAPSNTNISFMLDGTSTGPAFTFFPTERGNGFEDQAILQLDGLKNGPHVIVGTLAPGSTFIVSYLNISAADNGIITPIQSSETLSSESVTNGRLVTTSTSAPMASSSSSLLPSKKNVTSFAALIGSVVGVLSVISFSIFLSLCYRRRASRKRLSRIQEEEEAAEIREFGARVHGPHPFRPRYFPGTLPPFDADEAENHPPPYGSNEGNTIMISPLPPPPPPPPPPPIHNETSQAREVSTPSLISITPITSPPISLRRSSLIGLGTQSYLEYVGAQENSVTSAEAEQSAGEILERRASTSSRRHRPQPSTEPREDETSDTESGGLLSSSNISSTPPVSPRPSIADDRVAR